MVELAKLLVVKVCEQTSRMASLTDVQSAKLHYLAIKIKTSIRLNLVTARGGVVSVTGKSLPSL